MNTEVAVKTESVLLGFARRLWPDLAELPLQRRAIGLGDVLTVTYAAPLALIGVAALIRLTDLALLRANLFRVWLLAALLSLFNRQRYFVIARIRADRYGSADGSLDGVILWSAIFVFGPSMLWLSIAWVIFDQATAWAGASTTAGRWRVLRAFTLELATQTVPPLLSLALYQRWGGLFPLPDLQPASIARAAGCLLVHALLVGLVGLGYLGYHHWAQRALLGMSDTQPMLRFFGPNLAISQLANPFGILGAGLLVWNGLPVFLFFTSGMLVVAFLARQLSWAGERSRQQSQVLLQLERLGNAVINMSPAEAHLAEVLQPHLPQMFPAGNLAVWTLPDQVLYLRPDDWAPDLNRIWPWLARQREAAGFLATEGLPWEEHPLPHNPVVIAPILEVESRQPIGGCYLELHALAQPWNRRSLSNLPPALTSLATLIASALNQSAAYIRSLELVRTGIPIGVEAETRWTQAAVNMQPGDLLIMYTDGIPEAQNEDGEFFTSHLLLEAVKQSPDRSAEAIQARILSSIDEFVGEAAQTDDITPMVIARDPSAER